MEHYSKERDVEVSPTLGWLPPIAHLGIVLVFSMCALFSSNHRMWIW